MTKNKAKNEGIGSLLGYLDERINGYYQKNNVWPGKIILSKESRDKIFAELLLEPTMDLCWFDKKDNYRGIKIEIKEGTFIELKGE